MGLQLTVVEALRGLAVLALGRPTGFLAVVVVAFLVVLGFSAFSVFSVFLAAGFLAVAALVAVFYRRR